MKTGYDLDGVIAPRQEPKWLSFIWIVFPLLASKISVWRIRNSKPLIYPIQGSVIISGRGGQNYTTTVKWLKKWGIKNKLYMMKHWHTEPYLAQQWKWAKIQSLNIDVFYEDDEATIKVLSDIKGLKIIKV